MVASPYQPIYEFTRGGTVESVHFGAAAVVDAEGNMIAHFGDPQAVTFLRSSAKPFQALPFFSNNGPENFQLNGEEKAIICASHSGTDKHVEVIRSIQRKVGIDESELLCGTHPALHEPTAERMRDQKEIITPNRHNCSGKHSGMLAFVQLLNHQGIQFPEELAYLDFAHPIQADILKTFASICSLEVEKIALGVDGCSAPNFAVPLYNAALAYARLAAPEKWAAGSPAQRKACRTIFQAMTGHPEMVAGPGRFDTELMCATGGRIVSKGGAEGYQAIGLAPGVLGPGSTGIGITLKISDGDDRNLVRSAVALEVMRQLGVLSEDELKNLQGKGPDFILHNAREITVGHGYPSFKLERP